MRSHFTRLAVPVLMTALLVFTAGLAPSLAAVPAKSATQRPADQAVGSVFINEFVASNLGGLQDEDGDYSDWIELYNPGAAPISLVAWSISDNPDNPGKWAFPDRTLPANGYLVVFASGKNRAPPAGQLHTNFRLSAAGEYLGLFNNSTPRQMVDQFSPQFPVQYSDISYGRYNTPGVYRYFSRPTPGAINDFASAYLGVVAGANFQYPRGYYDNTGFNVALQTSTSGASIRHTRTGYAPTATSGTLYTGPVSIYDSMPLRAIAYKTGYRPSQVDTHSYILPPLVILQPADPSGFPLTWGWYDGQQVAADYEMDPAVVGDPRYAGTMRQDLRSLPAISIAASRVDLFDEWDGIYSNPMQTGVEWERPASVELIYPDGSTGFQVNAGLRIHGNATRRPSMTPKHSLRLHFRSEYGAAELAYPLFPDTAVDSFEVVVLRAMLEDTWLYDGHALYVRDQWMRDTQLAMQQPAAHGRFVHVYLDGLYWGIYNLMERLDDHFAAAYFGGSEADYDIVVPAGPGYVAANAGDTAAWNAMLAIAEAGLASPAQYAAIQQYLDLPNLIDYMITHIYAATGGDWLQQNWTAIRQRQAGAGFQFFCWDNEGVLHSVNADLTAVGSDRPNTPAYLYYRLRDNPEFRLLFADRVQRHFFNGGALYVDPAYPQWDPLHPERNQPAARFVQRADEVDRAVVPESARWGDGALNSTATYTRDSHWVIERNWVLNTLLPQRSAVVLQQLRNAGLYPTVVAPAFSQHGGSVPAGFLLSMAAPAGTSTSPPTALTRAALALAQSPPAPQPTPPPLRCPAVSLRSRRARLTAASGAPSTRLPSRPRRTGTPSSSLRSCTTPWAAATTSSWNSRTSAPGTLNWPACRSGRWRGLHLPGFTLGPGQFAVLVNNTVSSPPLPRRLCGRGIRPRPGQRRRHRSPCSTPWAA
jgi:hypothetical protein